MFKTSIIWRGVSLLDNVTPIRVLLVPDSGNAKTGPMWQTYIVRDDLTPFDALQQKQVAAICGDCPHSVLRNNTCYAQRSKGLISLSKKHNAYEQVTLDVACDALRQYGAILHGTMLRLGAYGDPAAVPVAVWEQLCSAAAGWTGYTHQWRDARFSALKQFCMASADTQWDAIEAQAMGWRTFRVRRVDTVAGIEDTDQGEVVCPASAERDLTTCERCRACDGMGNGKKVNITIIDHSMQALALRKRLAVVQ